MRILQSTTAIGWSGGTEQCFLLAKYLNSMGISTDILTFPDCELDRRARAEGIKTVYFPNTKKLSLREAKKLSKIIENYDIVNTHISKAHWFVWFSTFFLKKRPRLVFTRRVPFKISKFSLFTKYKIHTDFIIAVSREIETMFKSLGFKNLAYIPSGVEIERFDPKVKSAVREELGIESDAIVFVNVGNFSEVKGHHILLPAFQKFTNTYKRKTYLLLAGRDTRGSEAKKLVEKLNLQDKVKLLGFRRDIPQILKASDIFIFPSLNEGIAGSLIQAMAMGKIVVSTTVGGIKHYLKDGVNGIAIKPEIDSIVDGLLKSASLKAEKRQFLSMNARNTAQEFNIEKTVKRTLDIYASLLKEP